jgi:Na+-transporting methylmalonyl-CoA/oxaloacetate decarboxylase gamma subunit
LCAEGGFSLKDGILVMIGGMSGVFFVLLLFYILIKLIVKLFPYKPEEND